VNWLKERFESNGGKKSAKKRKPRKKSSKKKKNPFLDLEAAGDEEEEEEDEDEEETDDFGANAIVDEILSRDFKVLQDDKPKKVYRIASFNGNRFDMIFFRSRFIKEFKDYDIVGTSGSVKRCRLGQNIEFFDYAAVYPLGSLEQQHKTAFPGREYQKGKVDFAKITPDTYMEPEIKEEIEKYCEMDVILLCDLVQMHIERCEQLEIDPMLISTS
jgi:hypothetical protein